MCAYREAARSLIGPEILEDYFLGHLVGKSLLMALQTRLAMYTPIVWEGMTRTNDRELLQELLAAMDQVEKDSNNNNNDDKNNNKSQSDESDLIRQRAMYGITVRLDESISLESLRNEVLQVLANLDASTTQLEDDVVGDEESATKRIRGV